MSDSWSQTLIKYGVLPDPGRYFKKIEKLPPLKGTYFFGGAGLNGEYIGDFVKALKEAGIANVRAGNNKESIGRSVTDSPYGAMGVDAAAVPVINGALPGVYTTITAGEFDLGGSQFNLIGYSYGTAVAAHKAIGYAGLYGGIVDHLVLIGAPMQSSLLNAARAEKNIKKVLVVNLSDKNDPIYAGMGNWEITSTPQLAWQMYKQNGHFWYAPMTPEGHARRRVLAKYLFDQGLR